jgi:hypothetical protein
VGNTFASTTRRVGNTFSGATRQASRTFSSTRSRLSQSVSRFSQSASNRLGNQVSRVSRNTLSAANRLGSRTLSSARNFASNSSRRYNNFITDSYLGARHMQRSRNPFMRAAGHASVGVHRGIAGFNRSVDNAATYWKGVRGPVGRVGQGLVFVGKTFTSPLRALDHSRTNAQRNAALRDTAVDVGLMLTTGGLGKAAKPALKALSRTPLGRASVRQLSQLGRSQMGRAATRQLARLGSTASRANTAPARALSRSSAGRALLRSETQVRGTLSRINHFGASRTAGRSTTGAGYGHFERKTSVPNAERLVGSTARQPRFSSFCGHACVSNVNRTLGGRNVSMWDLTRTNPPAANGLEIDEVAGMLNALGHKSRVLEKQNILQIGREVNKSGAPAVLLREGHFITVDSVQNGMVHFRDPLAGVYRAPLSSFEGTFHSVVVDR